MRSLVLSSRSILRAEDDAVVGVGVQQYEVGGL